MKSYLIAIIIFLFGITLTSCEGPKLFSVNVVDKLTRYPIDSVFVQVKVKRRNSKYGNYDLQGYTDSSGKFRVQEMIGMGLSPVRIDFFMEYKKNGYKDKTDTNKTEGIVELEK